jgi:hypothetical protein
MLINNKPWQTLVNAENLSKTGKRENNLTVAQKNNVTSTKGNVYTTKVVTPKRYSFDDNGGGYEGL